MGPVTDTALHFRIPIPHFRKEADKLEQGRRRIGGWKPSLRRKGWKNWACFALRKED